MKLIVINTDSLPPLLLDYETDNFDLKNERVGLQLNFDLITSMLTIALMSE